MSDRPLAAGQRTAFLVLCHADPDQVVRLVRALGPRAVVFVHVDAKSSIAPFARLRDLGNVTLLADRVTVRWGGLSVIDATLRLVEAALATGKAFDRLVLLSGACFPLEPLSQLQAHFAADPAREFIRFAPVDLAPPVVRVRVHRHWLFDRIDVPSRRPTPALLIKRLVRKVLHLGLAPLRRDPASELPGFRLAYGSQWWAITPACARHVLEADRMHPALRRFFATSLAPDEMFIHTIVANSPFAAAAGGWREPPADGVAGLANLHLIDPTLLKVFDERDFPVLTRSGRHFVRKVSPRRSAALLDRIERELLDVPQAGPASSHHPNLSSSGLTHGCPVQP